MTSSMISGIDVSYYQGNIDWQTVKDTGIAFAFARATYGTTKLDPRFGANWEGIKSVGLTRGAYHFFVAEESAVEQANFFSNTVGSLAAGDLPPVLDVEAGSGTSGSLASDVQAWLDTVEQRLGVTPMIYTAPSYWNEYLNSDFGRYPLWVAEYGVAEPRSVKGWEGWNFWQHSQAISVAGIAGTVDADYFNGSYDNLLAFVGTSPGETVSASDVTEVAQQTLAVPQEQTYTVRAGDTLSAIAERYNTTVAAISSTNGIEDPNLIREGQVLTIP